MSMPKTISVVIATHNRAASLARTLEAMSTLAEPEAQVTFVVVDNASTDGTAAVLRGFASRLRLHALYEPKCGKNNALNRALDHADLGEIVVFTDDDVIPAPNWLVVIAAACERHPDTTIFGGRIEIAWPAGNVPAWARSEKYSSWAFAKVDFGDTEMPWPPTHAPFGPNYWVRRDVFADGRRFDPQLGPKPKGRIMGDETTFLDLLRKQGNEIVYVPEARVRHCIDKRILTLPGIRERAFTMGRTGANQRPWRHVSLLQKHPLVWRLARTCSYGRYLVACALAYLNPSPKRRAERLIDAMWGLGWNYEMLRLNAEGARPAAAFRPIGARAVRPLDHHPLT